MSIVRLTMATFCVALFCVLRVFCLLVVLVKLLVPVQVIDLQGRPKKWSHFVLRLVTLDRLIRSASNLTQISHFILTIKL